MLSDIIIWGTVIGLIHFVIVGALYSNPFVDKFYREGQETSAALRRWPDQKEYILKMFLGTQVEVYIMTAAYLYLAPLIKQSGLTTVIILGVIFSGIRVYPRFWNMFIQTTYPAKLLLIEFINGILSTFTVVGGLAAILHFIRS